MKMLTISKLFFACAILCATIVASNAQTQHARSSRVSSSVSAGVILCQPGFVFRCNSFGCFCVRP